MNYSIGHIAQLLHLATPANPDYVISTLLIDSRSLTYPQESLFFALRTRNNDGHRYVAELYGKGVRNFVVENIPNEMSGIGDANFLVVPDVLKALQLLARLHREQFDVPVVGITGSRGKTTVKEWIYQLLQAEYNIVRSPRSYNSQIGVPLSLWEMDADTRMAVF